VNELIERSRTGIQLPDLGAKFGLVAIVKGHHEVGPAASDSGSGFLDNAAV
jgi:hypothetical protein